MRMAVIGSFLIAILHSILFYGQRLGLSVFLFCIALGFFVIYVLEKNNKIKNKKALILAIPILLISTTYFIFNNSFFYVCNIIVLIILFAIMVVKLVMDETSIPTMIRKVCFLLLGPIEFIEEAIGSIIETITGFFSKKKISKDKDEAIRKVIIGVLIAIPILIIILLLLMSADSIFSEGIRNLLSTIFSLEIFESSTYINLFFRIIIIVMITIYFIALLYNIIEDKFGENNEIEKEKKGIDKVIGNTILTLLNIVYVFFCYIQISVLFLKTGNMQSYEYASYARQGFFQLMAVSFINLVIILITTRRDETNKKLHYTKIMNLLLAIFTVIILISSFYRMYLYEQEYGYTFLRLMVYFILVTEIMLIIPTIMYILNMKVNLSKSYFVIIVLMYLVVNYINIDNIIAKKNIDRYFQNPNQRTVDIYYLETLGIDAVGQIQRLENSEDEEVRAEAKTYLQYVRNDVENINFQNFNINRVIVKNRLK